MAAGKFTLVSFGRLLERKDAFDNANCSDPKNNSNDTVSDLAGDRDNSRRNYDCMPNVQILEGDGMPQSDIRHVHSIAIVW